MSLGPSCCCPGASCETLRTDAEPVVWPGVHLGKNRLFSNPTGAPFPPVSQAKPMVPTTPGICPSCSCQLLGTHGFLEPRLSWDWSTAPFLVPGMYCSASMSCACATGWLGTTLRTNFSEKAEPPKEPPVPDASRCSHGLELESVASG